MVGAQNHSSHYSFIFILIKSDNIVSKKKNVTVLKFLGMLLEMGSKDAKETWKKEY